MKHSYREGCLCVRCERELKRRTAQSAADPRRQTQPPKRRRKKPTPERRPVVGSAEWAETRGDDLGESPDY